MLFHKIFIFVFIPILSWPIQLLAWEFSEHRELGESAYLQSCRLLEKAYENAYENAYDKDKYTKLLTLLKSVPCSDTGEKSRQYGIRAALAADHVKLPDDFDTESAERQALSWLNYGHLALKNHEHFWPHVKTTWRKHHDKAIDLAIEAKELWDKNRRTKSVMIFERALIFSAYADHFLHDAYSIGHNGFSRINSSQNTSLIFHDEWNENGRWLRGKKYYFDRENIDISTTDVMSNVSLSDASFCDPVFSTDRHTLKEKNVNCELDIWFALGDGKLADNKENRIRVIETNTFSIISVILSFLDGQDRGYSMLADNMFPIATQSFQQFSAYARFIEGGTSGRYIISHPESITEKCLLEDGGVYNMHGICWFDVENTFMEPVYPDITLGLNKIYFDGYDANFDGLYFAYSPHSPSFFSSWPKNVRIYTLRNLGDVNIKLGNIEISTYRETGLNLILPNFYEGTLVSHEIDVAYAFLSQETGKYEEGSYLGINTNLDILKAKVSFGLGWFLPTSDLSEAKFKAQLMLGWNFGVLGGGPLSRWEE